MCVCVCVCVCVHMHVCKCYPCGLQNRIEHEGVPIDVSLWVYLTDQCMYYCVCVCVRAFVFTGNRGHEPTHQNQIEDNTATVDCPRFPSIREMVQTNANACGYTCKKTQKVTLQG